MRKSKSKIDFYYSWIRFDGYILICTVDLYGYEGVNNDESGFDYRLFGFVIKK